MLLRFGLRSAKRYCCCTLPAFLDNLEEGLLRFRFAWDNPTPFGFLEIVFVPGRRGFEVPAEEVRTPNRFLS